MHPFPDAGRHFETKTDVDAVPDEQLHLPATTVTGTVQDATYAVWVNGVEAVVEADGHWTASGVPVSEGGTASFHARAYPPGEHPATGSGVPGVSPASPYAVSWAVDNDKKPQVRVLEYHVDWTETISHGTGGKLSEIVIDAPNSSAYHLSWHDSAASDGWSRVEFADRTCQKNFVWPPDVCILREQAPSLSGTMTNTCGDGSTNWPAPVIYAEHCNVTNVTISTNSASVSTNSYRRTAQTILQLRTGGKPLSHRMTLFRVHAEASRITSPRWPVEGGYSGEAIPATNLAVGELGALGADGNLWKALPDNSIHDVTVSVQGGYAPTNFYTFDVTPEKYPLHVLANDYSLADDRVRTNAYFCVGQKVTFQAMFTPDVPGMVSANPTWSYGAEHINHHYTDDSSGCEIYLVAPYWVTQNPTRAWFCNGGKAVHAFVGLDCIFSNGQTAYVTARGKMDMYRPTIAIWNTAYTGTPQLMVSSGKLGLGASGTNEMVFMPYIQSAFAGTAGFTQLISGSFLNDFSISTSGYELDSVLWMRGLKAVHVGHYTQNNIPFNDGPSVSLATLNDTTAIDLSFQTYLRFKPDAGNPDDNIYVTLSLVSWGVSASATKTGGVWQLDSRSLPSGPAPSDSIAFPVWMDTFSNW